MSLGDRSDPGAFEQAPRSQLIATVPETHASSAARFARGGGGSLLGPRLAVSVAELATVGERFDGMASEVGVETRSASFEFGSSHEAWDSLERANGPLNALKQLSPPETYAETSERGRALMEELNRAEDGRLAINCTYALVVARAA